MKAASVCALWLFVSLPSVALGAATGDGDASQESGSLPLWLNPGFFTYHFDRGAGLRGLNWGAGLQADVNSDLSLLGGTYLNSDYARSDYAALAWQPLAWHAVRIGVLAGAANGYPGYRNGGWFPAVLPWISVRGERVGLNLAYTPNYRGVHQALVAQLMLRIW